MNTSWYRRLVRLMAGPVAAACVIGGAMGLSAIAHWCTIGVSVIFSKGLLVHHPVCR